MNSSKKSVSELLLEQLEGKHAHVDFDGAVKGLTLKTAGTKIEGLHHTIWQLIEHIRIAQEDIIDFSKNSDYTEMDWPADYWVESPEPESEEALNISIQAVNEGLEEMRELIKTSESELLKPIPHGNGQTLFREAMLIVDHNAYHIGQIVQIRRLLDNW